MPDPGLSEALAEAYASAPDGVVILDTLEIWHPAFTTALRIVADGAALDARIEAGAPRDAGELVTFVPLAFRLRPPESAPEAPGVLEAEIDTANREIVAEIDAAVVTLDPIQIIWRRYIASTAEDGPDYVVPGLTVRSVSAGVVRMTAQAAWQDLVNERFPRLIYSRDQFPTLELGG